MFRIIIRLNNEQWLMIRSFKIFLENVRAEDNINNIILSAVNR